VQYLYLYRIRHPQQQTVQYVYQFNDHRLSPNNLVIRKLFYCMLETLQGIVTKVEIEYSDAEMVKLIGMEQAVKFLTVMGAQEAEKQEYRKDGVLLSRTFTATITPERLAYFYALKDLDIVYRLRFLADETERIHIYFAETLSCVLTEAEEASFLELLSEQHVPHKILEKNR
jgi:hypothetical protein